MVLQSVVLPGKVFTNVSLQIKDECAMMVIGSTPWKMCHLSRFTPKQQTWNVVLHLRTWLFFSNEPVQHTVRGKIWLPESLRQARCMRTFHGTLFFGRRGPGTFEEGPHTQKQCVAARWPFVSQDASTDSYENLVVRWCLDIEYSSYV